MTRLAIFDQPAPTRIVRLAHPIEVDGETVTHVEARPPTKLEFADMRAGRITPDDVVALCAGLPSAAGQLFSDLDNARLVEVIANLSAETVQMVLDAKRSAFQVIEGGAA